MVVKSPSGEMHALSQASNSGQVLRHKALNQLVAIVVTWKRFAYNVIPGFPEIIPIKHSYGIMVCLKILQLNWWSTSEGMKLRASPRLCVCATQNKSSCYGSGPSRVFRVLNYETIYYFNNFSKWLGCVWYPGWKFACGLED